MTLGLETPTIEHDMANSDLINFLKKATTDAGLSERCRGLTPSDLAALGASQGFRFSKQDVHDYAKEMTSLTDEQLDGVAGGVSQTPSPLQLGPGGVSFDEPILFRPTSGGASFDEPILFRPKS